MRRVLITGIGIVAPSGLGKNRFWDAIVNRADLIGRISRFDPSGYACQIGGQVDDALLDGAVDPRKQRTTSHATRLALVAAEQSLSDARLAVESYAADSIGVSIGTALGGVERRGTTVRCPVGARSKASQSVRGDGAGPHGSGIEIAAALGAEGAQVTFASGCPSSLQALGYAANLIAGGELDVCLAGGTESPLSPTVVAALGRTQELSTTNDDPLRASRPFDASHNGMVLSEGSCYSGLGIRRQRYKTWCPRLCGASEVDIVLRCSWNVCS